MSHYWVILFVISSCSTDAYKFLVYSPIFGYSHTNFMGAIADTLTEAGHDVTVLMPVLEVEQEHKTGVKLTKKIIKTPVEPRAEEMMRHRSDRVSRLWKMQPSVFGLLQIAQNMTSSFIYQCEALVSNSALMKRLSEEKFDVGIAEPVSICGLGIFEAVKIPSSIAAFSGVHVEIVSKNIGEPINPSYVPGGMATNGDQMGLVDRLKNFVEMIMAQKLFGDLFTKEIHVFKEKFGSDFKNFEEILADTSYVFTNSNPYLDYPRPMLHKTVAIGGIAVHTHPKKNELSKKWDSILSERNTTVLVSFGSVARAIYMPDEYKENLLEVFKSMPETTFIWKYEAEGSQIAAHLENVHISAWVPQNALLADPRLTAFITHGGLGSTTELAHLGKPAILVPLFADQTRNAHMLAKHGGGIVISKFALEHPQMLMEALEKIFNDASFSHNAKRLSQMLLNQPVSAKQLLVRHCEFAAKFGRLPNLDPYGRHLSFFQYYLIDLLFVVVTVVVVSLMVVVKTVRMFCSLRVKVKKE